MKSSDRAPAFRLVRSHRRTLALQVRPDGTLTVRAPFFMRASDIEGFVLSKRSWIEKTAERLRQRVNQYPKVRLETDARRRHQEDAFMALTLRCQHFAPRMGVRYSSLGLSNARCRWGSCSADGRIRFNWRLALVPAEILDYVVVHELAHLRHPDHSPRFWAEVEKHFPAWREAKRWLKDNQDRLTAIL